MKIINFPFKIPAIRVIQPLGTYFVAVLPARLLLDVAYSDALSANLSSSGSGYELTGTQRLHQPKRLQPIAEYIDRIDCAFPNSIILAANFRQEDGLIEEDEWAEDDDKADTGVHLRWTIEEDDVTGAATLTIPSNEKLAAIIDGQHRVFAFARAAKERLDMDMICSVFLDLPKPFQAQLFATINSTQKQVSKSLTYELFGYNLDDEEEKYWSPDKLAVFLARKLGTEETSPLKGRIVVAPKRDAALEKLSSGKEWKVSTAVIVEGLMRLFTSNPKRDTAELLGVTRKERHEIEDSRKDKSPLRNCYLKSEDAVVYQMALNYLKACDEVLWREHTPGSFIVKTVGIQALFDILRLKAAQIYQGRDIRVSYFVKMLQPAAKIDFSDDKFRNASGSGRSIIRREIESVINI